MTAMFEVKIHRTFEIINFLPNVQANRRCAALSRSVQRPKGAGLSGLLAPASPRRTATESTAANKPADPAPRPATPARAARDQMPSPAAIARTAKGETPSPAARPAPPLARTPSAATAVKPPRHTTQNGASKFNVTTLPTPTWSITGGCSAQRVSRPVDYEVRHRTSFNHRTIPCALPAWRTQ